MSTQQVAAIDKQKSMTHLLEVAHLYAMRAPAVSRSLALQMRSLASSGKFRLHASILQRFCHGCSQVSVPGWNCSSEVVPKRKRQRQKKKKLKAAKQVKLTPLGSDAVIAPPPAGKAAHFVPAGKGKKRPKGGQGKGDPKGSGAPKGELKPPGSKRVQQVCWVCGHRQLLQTITKLQAPQDVAKARKTAAISEAANARAAVKRAKAAKKEASKASTTNSSGFRTLG
mmetsp:Transcript_63160/g.150590  ORF Transcript_63160/g.150590 Transcript_63160/m.150590 type:complete len:226 (+) Transcript_63160:139-816(+)